MPRSIADFIQRTGDDLSEHPGLLESLRDLDSMIGMEEAKSSIVIQLEFYILQMRNKGSVFDDAMLHTVITGPPGVGKTELGKVLARIWKSLGVLKGQRSKRERSPLQKSLSEIASISNNLNSIGDYLSDSEIDLYSRRLRRIVERHQEPPAKRNVPFRVVSRVDFVAGYVGQTAIKTEELLRECLGGVVFIDEAYSLFYGTDDDFGMEALTTLNQFMSEHSDEIIVIFAGYRDLMNNGIFKKQPGLKSRCSWYIDVEGYSGESLAKIFRQQLKSHGWALDKDVNLNRFFEKNLKEFPDYGRNTSRFLFYCKLYHMDSEFVRITDSKKRRAVPTKIITDDAMEIALKKYKSNCINRGDENSPPPGLYI